MSALDTIEGATVLVTGASSGIGAALAPMLAARGATVGIAARRADRLATVLDACRAANPGSAHRAWPVDLADPEAAAALADDAWDGFGALDAVVNNAAIPMRRAVTALDVPTVEAVMRTNFLSPVALGLAVLPRMLARGRGVIVNVSSLGGRLGVANEAAYSASKFALSGWTEAMAIDLWSSPVGVRLVTPGAIDTEIWDQPGNDPADYDGPLEPPETVAEAICEVLVTEGFECYVPDLQPVAELKVRDIDGFLAGVAAFAAAGREPTDSTVAAAAPDTTTSATATSGTTTSAADPGADPESEARP
jgi:short-subunit dehydrogenase